jgi:hypothetical protein
VKTTTTTIRQILLSVCIMFTAAVAAQSTGYSAQYSFAGEVLNQYDSVFTAQYHIHMQHAAQYAKIHLKITEKETGNVLITNVYNTGGANHLTAGESFSLSGNTATIVLSASFVPYKYEIDIRLEDNNGNMSDKLEWTGIR